MKTCTASTAIAYKQNYTVRCTMQVASSFLNGSFWCTVTVMERSSTWNINAPHIENEVTGQLAASSVHHTNTTAIVHIQLVNIIPPVALTGAEKTETSALAEILNMASSQGFQRIELVLRTSHESTLGGKIGSKS